MNKMILLYFSLGLLSANTEIYWDLGVGISNTKVMSVHSEIELSAFHRIEGLKQYYNSNFNGAIYHFSTLEGEPFNHIIYEYVSSYYYIGQFNKGIALLADYDNYELSANLIYLKSQLFTMLEDYEAALNTLKYLRDYNGDTDYLKILQFEIEKINLLIAAK